METQPTIKEMLAEIRHRVGNDSTSSSSDLVQAFIQDGCQNSVADNGDLGPYDGINCCDEEDKRGEW